MVSKSVVFFNSIIIVCQAYFITSTEAHGRLIEPPARNTLWRFGFEAPPNYNDNELFCGGIQAIIRNNGKCGICGDPYDGRRTHETGDEMAINEITRNYYPGSSVDLMVDILGNHGGKFKFEICWRDSFTMKETEECFEPLKLSKSSEKEVDNEYEYELDISNGKGIYTMSVDLPANRTCENCILRWHWRAANNWGKCDDGLEKVGCGPQEIYRNCADVSIRSNGAGIGLGLRRK